MTVLPDKKVVVTLARPMPEEFFRTQDTNAVIITDHRVTFNIRKTLNEKPNDATVTITNLAEGTRNEFAKKPLSVRVEAMHAGAMVRIFTGDLRHAQTTREGPHIVTKFQVGDGDRAFKHARVNRSYRGGVNLKTAVVDVAKSMGLRVPRSMDDLAELKAQFTAGLSLTGPSQQQMTKLLRARGLNWSMQDGSLQVLSATSTRQGEAFLVSQSTGMVSSPEFNPPTEPGKPPVMTVKSLLYPALLPGSQVLLQAEDLKGYFRIQSILHTGDSRGPEWFTTIEATPV